MRDPQDDEQEDRSLYDADKADELREERKLEYD